MHGGDQARETIYATLDTELPNLCPAWARPVTPSKLDSARCLKFMKMINPLIQLNYKIAEPMPRVGQAHGTVKTQFCRLLETEQFTDITLITELPKYARRGPSP